jgi:hypothetical protein
VLTNIDLYVCAVGEQKGEEKGRRILLLPLEHRWLTQHTRMIDTVTKKNKDFFCYWTSKIPIPLNR